MLLFLTISVLVAKCCTSGLLFVQLTAVLQTLQNLLPVPCPGSSFVAWTRHQLVQLQTGIIRSQWRRRIMMGEETSAELQQDIMLGIIFLILAVFSLKRLLVSATQSGTEAVITTFYSLILLTSLFRAVWFLIPKAVVEPTYTPTAQYAFRGEWLGTFWMDVLLFLGSMSLFSIFILMAIFWADLLTGIFKESGRPSRPMTSFTTAAAGLAAAEVLNSCLFLFRLYSTQGMLMFESVLLFVLCLVCSVEISRYSHRFRTVLTTLGAVNQISTEGQITRIIRITIIANLFFAVRAACELTLAIVLYLHYKRHHSWNAVFKDDLWNWYIVVRHASEALILCLMLWILHEEPESEEAEGGGLADVEGGRTR
ncbi:unnamed protein product, partial [Ascophyllum nodosum]